MNKTMILRAAALIVLLAMLAGCGERAGRFAAPPASDSVSQVLEQAAASAVSEPSQPAPSASAAEPAAGEPAEPAPPASAAEPAVSEPSQPAPAVSAAEPAVSEPTEPAPSASEAGDVDVDLTRMSATMVYAQVSQIVYDPESYFGKVIRMRGQSYSTRDETTDTTYYAVIIADATACCAQGIEYALAGGDYPPDDEEVTVVGTFELYEEAGMRYCRLGGAVRED